MLFVGAPRATAMRDSDNYPYVTVMGRVEGVKDDLRRAMRAERGTAAMVPAANASRTTECRPEGPATIPARSYLLVRTSDV